MENRKEIYRKILSGERAFYGAVIAVDTIAYTVSFLVSGLVKKDIFNLLEGREGTLGITSLKLLILLNVAMPLVINSVKQINSAMTTRVRMRFTRKIKAGLLWEILNEKMGGEKMRGFGESVSLFRNECEDVTEYLMEYYRQLPGIVLSMAILLVMFGINPLFALISLIPAFGITALIRFLDRRIVELRRAARSSTGNVTEFLENVLRNVEYFRLSVGKEQLTKIFEDKCRIRSKRERRDRVLDKTLAAASANASGLVLGIILLTAIPLYLSGRFSVGEFVMFEYYYVFLASLPDAAGRLIRRKRQADISLERIFRQRDTAAGQADPDTESLLAEAEKGEVILITGGRESERSLILQRLFQTCRDGASQKTCTYVPARPVLFDETILENICFGNPFEEKKLWEVVEKAHLEEDIAGFPEGIRKQAGKMGGSLSGGQRKRVALARALYDGGEILFLDGLSEDVDKKTEKALAEKLLNDPQKVIFVASDSQEIRKRCDKAYESEAGLICFTMAEK